MTAERTHPARRAAPRRGSASALARDVTVLGLIWASSVVFQRVAVAEIDPLSLVAVRITAAVAFFLPFLPRIRRGLAGGPRRLLDVLVIGGLNPAASGVLTGMALQVASSGLVAVLISLAPLMTALLAMLLRDEQRLGRSQVVGLAVAFGGVSILIATRSTGLGDALAGDLRGHALALTVALTMAVSTIYTRRRLRGIDPLSAAAGQNAAGLLIAAPVALVIGETVAWSTISAQTWVAVIVSGTVGLAASFVLFLGMIERHGSTGSLLALYVMPVGATILGALFLGETITPPMAAGAALVLAGVVLFTRR
jgi:drug/metabolite transporter (DMT)-like permease